MLLAVVVAASLVVIAARGHGQPSAAKHPTYSDYQVATREYRDEAAGLTLAPGWSWPEEPIPATYQGSEVRYELGYGTQAADQFWFCTWAVRAVEARPASADRIDAVRRLQVFRDMYYFKVLNEKSRPYVDQELRRALAGELDLVRTDVEANCPQRG
jgi:hypothetical protein